MTTTDLYILSYGCKYEGGSAIGKGFNYAVIKFIIDEDVNFACINAMIHGDKWNPINVNVKRIFWITEE